MGAAACGCRAPARLRTGRADRSFGRFRALRGSDHRATERLGTWACGLVGGPECGRDRRPGGHRPPDAPLAPARGPAQARPRVSGRGAVALPHGAARRHDGRARGARRAGASERRRRHAGGGGRAAARVRCGFERARSRDARPLRARPRLRADDREGAASRARRGGSPQLGCAAARHRQARGTRGGAQQTGAADG